MTVRLWTLVVKTLHDSSPAWRYKPVLTAPVLIVLAWSYRQSGIGQARADNFRRQPFLFWTTYYSSILLKNPNEGVQKAPWLKTTNTTHRAAVFKRLSSTILFIFMSKPDECKKMKSKVDFLAVKRAHDRRWPFENTSLTRVMSTVILLELKLRKYQFQCRTTSRNRRRFPDVSQLLPHNQLFWCTKPENRKSYLSEHLTRWLGGTGCLLWRRRS